MSVASPGTSTTEPARLGRRVPPAWLEPAALAVVAVACVVAFFAWPVGPTYDIAHQLLWGRDIVDGRTPELSAFRAPTEHPLTLLLGIVLAPLGDGDAAGRIVVALCLASFVALIAGTFSLTRTLFGRTVAWLSTLLVLSRLDYAALAIRSYLDIPYLALVLWAAALEARRPRRGGWTWALLIAAGLLRPEAWLLIGLYGIWIVSAHERWWLPSRAWVRPGLLILLAPVIWLLTDLAITGEPLFSLTYTSGSAAELQHQGSLLDVPRLVIEFTTRILKWPVAVACTIGLLLAVRFEPRRAILPLVLVVSGIVTFALIVAAGLAAIDRYLVITALGLQILGGYALGGWLRATDPQIRRIWAGAASVMLLAGVAFAATHTNTKFIRNDLDTRVQVPRKLAQVLNDPQVVAARRCGPVTLPNQKLIADVRLVLGGARASEVLARGSAAARGVDRGVALTITKRSLTWHPAYTPFGQGNDPRSLALPPAGFRLAIDNGWFAAYVRC